MAAVPRPTAKKSDPPPSSQSSHSGLRLKPEAKVDTTPPPSGVKPIAAKPPVPVKAVKPATPVSSAPKTPLPPRPGVATKSTPPAPLVGKASAPRPLAVSVKPAQPVAAPTIPTAPAVPVIAAPVVPVVAVAPVAPVAPVAVVPPPPAFLPAATKPQQASHTDIDLPPYFERPASMLDAEESDPDLLRRFETEVVERRKRLTRIAATVMGVAWMLCQIACARGIASSVVDAISSDDDPPQAAKAAVVVKDVKAKR